MKAEEKFEALKENLKKMGRVIIAFSGGVDSTFLLKTASVSGLQEILAVTSGSESVPEAELAFTKVTASELNIPHIIITTDELRDENYSSNPPDRCYYCKKELFTRLRNIAGDKGIPNILDGTNYDDINDWRPGRQAAQETGVRSPLAEAGLNKQEIRDLSKMLGLQTWDKPATPCLASRFPYGRKITAEALGRVKRAEAFLKNLNLKDLRVRDHGDTARIEVMPEDFNLITDASSRKEIVGYFSSLGYRHITLDLRGFKSGGFNEPLKKADS
ncbi:MAG: ATP-dependent sacrificial sulfur transferase LarE [Nitrospirae bacterium]|nr:ATP-dependent sacrificial sulfur transferase LarE [Nitrospirota bacterium]